VEVVSFFETIWGRIGAKRYLFDNFHIKTTSTNNQITDYYIKCPPFRGRQSLNFISCVFQFTISILYDLKQKEMLKK
jgi:hypothetical protein